MHPGRFSSSTLRGIPAGDAIQRILAAAIQAVEPGAAVRRAVQRQQEVLYIAGERLHLDDFEHISLVALGKAALPMAEAMADLLGDRLTAGLVIPKHAAPASDPRLEVLQGDHPVPGMHSLQAGERLLEFVSQNGPNDLVFCLISGGGSALVTAPQPGLSLNDLQQLTRLLLGCGASITEINTLRRRLDRIKGGGLARQAAPARMVSLVLSDVVGNPLEAIASGPTSPDPTTRQEALAVLERYHLQAQLAPAILQTLLTAPETPKAGEPLFENQQVVLVGSNQIAAQAALQQAEIEGFHPHLLGTDRTGEARLAALELCQVLRQARLEGKPVPAPACLAMGGETTVTLRGNGKGGRNQELALAAVTLLAGLPDVLLVSLATDGEDGPTDAAGAAVTGETYARAARLGMHPAEYLARNDSYSFFEALDDLLKPGPTGTNVNDLTLLFTF
jgi:hydroxypyruvate reductase